MPDVPARIVLPPDRLRLSPEDCDPASLIDGIMTVMTAAFDPAFGEAWNRQQVLAMLVTPLAGAMLIHGGDKDDAAGFALTRNCAGEAELLLIAVSPAWRGRGLGRRLLNEVIHRSRKARISRILLEMRDGNGAADLYRSCGFRPVGRRASYYRGADGSRYDAITFALSID